MDDKKQNPIPTQTPSDTSIQTDPFSSTTADPSTTPDPVVTNTEEPKSIDQVQSELGENKTDETPNQDQIFTSTGQKPTSSSGSQSKKIVATIAAVVLLIGGVAAGVYLVGNQQLFSQKAADSGATGDQAQPTAQCGSILAYDNQWNLLSATSLSKLAPGAVVRFTVSGTKQSGSFNKARFTINDVQRPVVTQKKPGTEDYYDEYIIPTGVTNFAVRAQIHHSDLGWI